jgi:hypothetical protein
MSGSRCVDLDRPTCREHRHTIADPDQIAGPRVARRYLKMRMNGLVVFAGLCLIQSISQVQAQCPTKEMVEEFTYTAKGGLNNDCTKEQVQSKKFCITSGQISSYRYDVVDEKNVVGTSEISQLDDLCLEATMAGHPKDSFRSPNGLICQPGERTILIRIDYCE